MQLRKWIRRLFLNFLIISAVMTTQAFAQAMETYTNSLFSLALPKSLHFIQRKKDDFNTGKLVDSFLFERQNSHAASNIALHPSIAQKPYLLATVIPMPNTITSSSLADAQRSFLTMVNANNRQSQGLSNPAGYFEKTNQAIKPLTLGKQLFMHYETSIGKYTLDYYTLVKNHKLYFFQAYYMKEHPQLSKKIIQASLSSIQLSSETLGT
jgi:hypothetical protein